jgi:exopolyphosphatase/guanosine-5'-triphosphate,3'-diphosphate pyrophosphatase
VIEGDAVGYDRRDADNEGMKVAVLDIGSNTARLLVADVRRSDVEAVLELKTFLRLGAEIERTGGLSQEKLDETTRVARSYAKRARRLGVERLETIVTAPGRQGSSTRELLHALSEATCGSVRVLSPDEEGALAFDGALSRADELPEVVSAVDVGGGSTELAVGTPLAGAAWIRSVDIGSLRLTRGLLPSDPPTSSEIARARDTVRRALDRLEPPRPDLAFAVGGSARAAARIIGRTYSADDLDEVVQICSSRPAAAICETFGIDAARSETVLAGAIILAEASRVLDRPLEVARGGLREGAALQLATTAAAVA